MKKTNLKRFSFILIFVLMLGVLAACSPDNTDKGDNGDKDPVVDDADKLEDNEEGEDDPVETSDFPKIIKDGFDNEVTLEEKPEKIVSLAPNNTEILFALGLDDRVVGVSTADNYPEEAGEKEKVGGYEGNNLERIIELETDLVVFYGNMATVAPDDYKSLQESGIAVLSYMPESIDETIDTIKSIGEATGSEEKAKQVTDQMTEKKDEIVEKVKDAEKKKVFYEIWHDPLQTAGPGSFMNEFINLANGENVAEDADMPYAAYDLETLVEKDPEIYIGPDDNPDATAEMIKERPGYEDLTAIKENQVYLVDGDLVSRAGPRIVEGLEIVAKTIHPELFD